MTPAASNIMQLTVYIFSIGVAAVLIGISLSFAAFILKAACRVAGEDAPDTGRAMFVSLLESVIGAAAYLCAGLVLPVVLKTASAGRETMLASVGFCAVTIPVIVPAGLYVPMLKVSLQKGLVIAVLRYVITFALAAALVYVLFAAGKVKL